MSVPVSFVILGTAQCWLLHRPLVVPLPSNSEVSASRLVDMHKCLSTLEALSHIFEDVYAEESGLKDTAALAVTCQTFREPALDILWRSLPNLVTLVRCLPEDAYKIVCVSDVVITMVRSFLS